MQSRPSIVERARGRLRRFAAYAVERAEVIFLVGLERLGTRCISSHIRQVARDLQESVFRRLADGVSVRTADATVLLVEKF